MRFTLFFSLIALVFTPFQTFAAGDFGHWVTVFKQEARSQGISEQTLTEAFSDIAPLSRVIELDRKQPEGRLTLEQYLTRVIDQNRIRTGQRLYREHAALLNQISQHYGVQPQYIVALWGLETSYGQNTGGFSVINALATLAYDGRRSEFFQSELLKALKIIDQGHISLKDMKGSWAGAMGQNQFMPSSFFNFAVDYDGDGDKDIWTSLPDIFASTANYLSQNGWQGDERWGREVRLPANLPETLMDRTLKKPLSFWKSAGVTLKNGDPVPVIPGFEAAIIQPDGKGGRAFLVYDNFETIRSWNRSNYFGVSVGLLADQIASGP